MAKDCRLSAYCFGPATTIWAVLSGGIRGHGFCAPWMDGQAESHAKMALPGTVGHPLLLPFHTLLVRVTRVLEVV